MCWLSPQMPTVTKDESGQSWELGIQLRSPREAGTQLFQQTSAAYQSAC